MSVTAIDREQANDQITKCEAELVQAEKDGIPTHDAEPTLRLARSHLNSGDFQKAFLFAVRARRMVVECRSKTEALRANVKK